MKNQVFVCETLYHVYISLLWNEKTKADYAESILVIGDNTPRNKELSVKLAQSGIFDHVVYVPFAKASIHLSEKRYIHKRTFLRNRSRAKFIEKYSEINKYRYLLENADFNVFSIMGFASAYFIFKYKNSFIRLMEDGERNYLSKIGKFKHFKRKYLFNTFIGEGKDKEIKEIHVQQPSRLPKGVRSKGVVLDLRNLHRNLSQDVKNRFMKCFWDKAPDFTESQTKRLLLITQPLSEDNFVSEDYKVEFYNKLLRKYGEGYQVFIKTHPREITDYKDKLEVPFIEIPRSFPLELLNFIDTVSFDLGVTIYSSAINNLNCLKEKIFLGMECDPHFSEKKRSL